jgi:hypothetical protein
VLRTIGQGSSEFVGQTAQELRTALEHATTRVRKGAGLDGFGVVTSYLPHYLLRKLGWVAFNAHPAAPMTYARLARAMQHNLSLAAQQ